jgi:hypothetical protein
MLPVAQHPIVLGHLHFVAHRSCEFAVHMSAHFYGPANENSLAPSCRMQVRWWRPINEELERMWHYCIKTFPVVFLACVASIWNMGPGSECDPICSISNSSVVPRLCQWFFARAILIFTSICLGIEIDLTLFWKSMPSIRGDGQAGCRWDFIMQEV